MAYVADLHLHSRFARACSKDLNIPNLAHWGKLKGVDLLGTGDGLHPLYQSELKSVLKDLGNGFYRFEDTQFVITTELACIYSEAGGGRRIHIIIFLPSLDSAFKLSEVLTKKGAKLASDGRPIIGISAKGLCELVFNVEPQALVIPAHIWTPWFGLFGSKSGYDRFEDCFGEFSDQIYAIETGLSSDPAMNWRVKDLDDKAILSFSDAHSVPRIGREVTIFGSSLNEGYEGLFKGIKEQNLVGTIEFYPEEGMYHYSGHRNCNVVYSPKEVKEKGEICPKCKRGLTIGVMQRVEELSSRSESELELEDIEGVKKSKKFPNRPGYRMLVQLEEVIAEVFGVAVRTQRVQSEYQKLAAALGGELKILTKVPLEQIAKISGEKIAEGVGRVRVGKLSIKPGFDMTYGVVKIWDEEEEKTEEEQQISLF